MKFFELIMLLISFITLILLSISLLKQKNKKLIHKEFILVLWTFSIYVLGLLLQIIFSKMNIEPIKFEYISFVGMAISPVLSFLIGITYYKEKNINIKRLWPLFIIPIISIFIIWFNDSLIFKKYSVELNQMEYGIWFYIYTVYTYLLYGSALVLLIISSIKKSGFISIQMFYIGVGALVPVLVNILLILGVFEGNVYITPILFSFMILCFYIAIIKLKAFNVIPVASRTVMDTMSDAYVVISNDGTIADSNKTFREKFKEVFDFNGSDNNLFEVFDKSELINLEDLKKHIDETRKKGKAITEEYHFENEKLDRYFEVDIHPISARDNKKDYIATLLVFKDITQHKLDIKEIEEKQDIIVKQQQLVSIGELAGGVAHDINTPISAIKTGIVMLNTMSGQRTDSEKEILERMDNCATKIINIVNSMRNQIRNLGGTTKVKFKVSSVINDIKVITYHEVNKNHSEVNVDIQDDVEIMGDPTKLGQVLTNLIVNAAQAYNEKGGKINIIVSKTNKDFALINVIDYAGGIDEEIAKYIFKNILTTKGISGTGLGLYLAYSVIKGEFNGEIDFNTKKGEGTTFSIKIPLAK